MLNSTAYNDDMKFEKRLRFQWDVVFYNDILLTTGLKSSNQQMKAGGKMSQKLYRSRKDRMISGVIGGFAEYLKVDPTLLRIGTVVLGLFAGFEMVIAYIVCLVLIPEKPAELDEEDVEILDENGDKLDHKPTNARLILGIGIVAFGVIQLMEHFLWWIDKDVYWGLGIIGVGVVVLLTAIQRKKENQ